MSVRPRVQEGYSRSEEVIYVAGHDAEVMQDRPVEVVEQGLSQPATAAGRRRASALGRRSRPELTCGAFPCSADLIP